MMPHSQITLSQEINDALYINADFKRTQFYSVL